jgi:putative aldouronate transport system substrate-binding protein
MRKALIAGCGLLLCVACGNTKNETAPAPEIADGLTRIEFTLFIPDANHKTPPDTAEIVQQVYKKTGVLFRHITPPAEPLERLNIMLATDDLPDLIFFNNPTIQQQFINAGKLLALDDLMKENAPQAYNLNYANFRDRIRNRADGKMYFLPGEYHFGTEDSRAIPETDATYVMRTGLLEELGWYNPDTFDKITELLGISRERYPAMIPLGLALGPQGHLETLNQIGAGAYGLTYEGSNIILDDGVIKYFTEVPRMKEWYAWLNGLRRAGYVDPESPIMSQDMLKEKVVAGKIYSWFGHGWEIGSAFIAYAESRGSDEQCLWYLFPRANASVKKTSYAPYTEGLYTTGLTVTKNNRDPVRFMKFYEWINTEEGWFDSEFVVNWDFHGKNTVEETEGYDCVVMPDAPQIYPGKIRAEISGWMGLKWNDDENWWWNRGLEAFGMFKYLGNHPNGKYDTSEGDVSMWWDDNTRRIYGAYGITGTNYWEWMAETGSDITLISGLNIEPDTEEAIAQLNMQEYLKIQLPKVIMAETPARFESLWREMVDRLNQEGREKFVAKKNELLRERLKDWNMSEPVR